MSVWRIAAKPVDQRATKSLADIAKSGLNALSKWIPAEVIALYATTVAAMQPVQPEDGPAQPPSVEWLPWAILLVATPLIVMLTALTKRQRYRLWPKVLLSMPAFVMWSATVPHSAWEGFNFFDLKSPLVLLCLAVAALIFTLLAEWIVPEQPA